jgi:hypothetical protein
MAAPVSLRLSDEKWRMYSDQAQAAGMGLSTYLKRRLEHGDEIAEQLASIRRVIQATAAASPAEAPDGLLIEILLLMRSVVGDAKLNVVHSELRRQNLPIWTGK